MAAIRPPPTNSSSALALPSSAICLNCAQQQRRCHRQRHPTLQIYCAWALITLLAASAAIVVQSAAVSFGDLLSHPTFKPLCSAQPEHFIESEGKESSLIIELKPGGFGAQHSTCTRILSAPPNYGFIVRLILPKLRHNQQPNDDNIGSIGTIPGPGSSQSANIMPATGSLTKSRQSPGSLTEMSALMDRLNSSGTVSAPSATLVGRTCPLNIFSSLDPHTAQWRVDPCQLEDTASEMEDPVRLFHGRVRIVWEHGQNALKSKLMITVLGKGEQCKDKSKHQCLKIGDEPILCISKELACDGIRHCPYSNEYDSDEDYELCFKQRRPGAGTLPSALESDLFEQFALEVFRNLFAYDAPTGPEGDGPRNVTASGNGTTAMTSTTTLRKVYTKDMKKPAGGEGSPNSIGENSEGDGGAVATKQDNETAETTGTGMGSSGSGFTRRNSTRNGIHSDLSKYGPWGYLMLGMLLCGGALLICGLWASASQHAVNNEREAALAAANGGAGGLDHQLNVASPPNYEELDPPPAYSVLFPNQKAASSNTLNLDGAAASSSNNANSTASAAAAGTPTATPSATLAAVASSETRPDLSS
ncbi:uncharacterized protein LOC6652463 [Drosophila willistoni]|nr:uncharacterized protein LOC6652463 [Drosophila willistoni]